MSCFMSPIPMATSQNLGWVSQFANSEFTLLGANATLLRVLFLSDKYHAQILRATAGIRRRRVAQERVRTLSRQSGRWWEFFWIILFLFYFFFVAKLCIWIKFLSLLMPCSLFASVLSVSIVLLFNFFNGFFHLRSMYKNPNFRTLYKEL